MTYFFNFSPSSLQQSTMMEQQGLPVYNGPIDHLRFGFRSLESEMSAPHAVAAFQKNKGEAEWACKMDMVRRSYGSHLAMRLASERAMFSRPRRLPGLQSSNISLDTVMGTDSTIDFADFLNGEQYNAFSSNAFNLRLSNLFEALVDSAVISNNFHLSLKLLSPGESDRST